jgi:type I restriction enzyme, R subunit
MNMMSNSYASAYWRKNTSDDPIACLIKLRELSELLAQLLAARVGLLVSPERSHDLLWRLEDQGYLPCEIAQLFEDVCRSGNTSNFDPGASHQPALSALKISWQLGLWFHRTFGNPAFESGPFIPPAAPEVASEELSLEIDRLSKELEEYRTAYRDIATDAGEAKDKQSFWEEFEVETEQATLKLKNRLFMQQVLGVPSIIYISPAIPNTISQVYEHGQP